MSRTRATLYEETIWLEHVLGRSAPYHVRVSLAVEGAGSDQRVVEACQAVASRHELLRSRFSEREGRLWRVVAAGDDAVPVRRSGPGGGDLDLDPERGPVAVFSVVRDSPRRHRVTLDAHHLVVDGTSKAVVARELARALSPGSAPVASSAARGGPALSVPREEIETLAEVAAARWRRAAPVPLHLPWRTGAVPSGRKRSSRVAVDAATRVAMVELAKRAGASPFHVLLATLAGQLRAYGSPRPIVGVAHDLRASAAPDGVGCAVNVVPVLLEGAGLAPVDQVQAVRGELLAVGREAAVPARLLVAAGSLPAFTGVRQLLALTVSYQRVPGWFESPDRTVRVRLEPGETTAGATGDVVVHAVDDGAAMACAVEVDEAMFDAGVAERLANDLADALRSGPGGGRRRTAAPARPGPRVDELFATVATGAGQRTAVVEGAREHSYAELRDDASRVAAGLVRRGVRRGDRVGVVGWGSYDTVAAMLGVLIAGCAYVPVDGGTPPARRAALLDGAMVRLVLVSDTCPQPASGVRIRDILTGGRPPGPVCPPAADDEDIAYVMHTSGSTGTPKGVEVTHRGIARLVGPGDSFAPGPRDVFLLHSTPAFDASTFEIWASLLNGARLVIQSPQPAALGDLAQTIRARGVTVLWLTAAVFGPMVDRHVDALGELRALVAGGDVLPVEQARRLLDRGTGCVLINGYGPTENTTFSTMCNLRRWDPSASSSAPIGHPVTGTGLAVVDDELEASLAGTAGELVVWGSGLARGYLGRPDLTAERFLPNPWGPPGSRMYRTGDRVRELAGGDLAFIGRMDREVKVRGVRVNLAEVEALLVADPEVRAVVVRATGAPPHRRLVAYVLPRAGRPAAELDPAALLRRSRERLPAAFVPDAVLALDALPLNANGKLETAALPALPALPPPVPAVEVASTPGDELAALLADAWRQRLGRSPAPSDDVFALGGNSLTLLQLREDLRERTGAEIALAALYEGTSFAAMLELLRREATEDPR